MNIDASKIFRRSVTVSAILALPVALALTSVAQSPAPQKAQGRDVTTDIDRPASAPAAKAPSPVAAPAKDKAAPSSANAGAAKATTKEVAIGTAVFCSDGQKMGEVNGVKSDSGGVIEEIHVKTGGLFGMGGKVLIVPGAKITAGGQTVQLALTSGEAGKLPVVADKKG